MIVRQPKRARRLGDADTCTPLTWWDPLSWIDSCPAPTQADSLQAGIQQIQSVPINASAANAAAVAAGIPAPYDVAAIQAAANLQSGAFQQENQVLWSSIGGVPWYVWALGAGLVALVVVRR